MIICYFNQCVVCQKKTVKKQDCTAFRIDFVPLRVHCLYRVHLATQDFTVIVKIQDLNFSLEIDRPRTFIKIFISLPEIIKEVTGHNFRKYSAQNWSNQKTKNIDNKSCSLAKKIQLSFDIEQGV